MSIYSRIARPLRLLLLAGLPGVLSACSTPSPGEAPGGIYDPYEARNRAIHARNVAADDGIVSRASNAYVTVVPDVVQQNVSNFADNAAVPGSVVNQILQGDLGGAGRNTLRFALNTTLGFAGLADVAKDVGLPKDEADFGQTLYVWGVPEGAYLVLPYLGPTTERDLAGRAVDLFTNPLSYTLDPPERYYGTIAAAGDTLSDRARRANTLESVLRDSADSYAQTRLIYLQKRRAELGYPDPAGLVDPYAAPDAR